MRDRCEVAPELSDPTSVVCPLTIGDGAATVDRQVAAFAPPVPGRPPAPTSAMHVCGATDPTPRALWVVDRLTADGAAS